jgi:hypothetical protein
LTCFLLSRKKTITFSKKLSKPSHPTLSYNTILIAQITSQKHLGVTLSHDARLKTHIHLLLTKVWKRIGPVKSFKFLLNVLFSYQNKLRLHISFIRPPTSIKNTNKKMCVCLRSSHSNDKFVILETYKIHVFLLYVQLLMLILF